MINNLNNNNIMEHKNNIMEPKTTIIPFDIELAKKITNGEIKGRIVTRGGRRARIICFDRNADDNIVALVEDEKGVESPKCYAPDGIIFLTVESDGDLMIETYEYLIFKDGDIIAVYDNIIICKDPKIEGGVPSFNCYARLNTTTGMLIGDSTLFDQKFSRFATEEEKQKLMKALQESEDVQYNAVFKMFFKEKKQRKDEFTFKQPVLVRQFEQHPWQPAEFGYRSPSGYVVIGGNIFSMCIPYNEETKHLMGTVYKWEEQ